MPTYEYACNSCDHRFETRQRMTDDPITTCPNCDGNTYRVLFPVGIVFKGSGFYKTDNRSKESEPAEAKADGKDTSSEEKSKTPAKEKAGPGKEESSSTDTAASASTTY